MLSSFPVEDFKSYRNTTLKLAPPTILIGANAPDKINAIETRCQRHLSGGSYFPRICRRM